MNPPLQLTDTKRPQYYIRVRQVAPNGKPHQTRVYLTYFDEGKRKAEQAKRQYLDSLGVTNARNKEGKNLTFTQFVDQHFRDKRNIKSSTRDYYESVVDGHLIPFFGPRPIDSLTLRDLLAYVRHTEMCLADTTVRSHLGVLRSILRRAERLEMLTKNPCTFLGDELGQKVFKREKRLLTPEQLSTLYNAADRQLKLVIEIASLTGMRISEILGLRPGDIDFEKQAIVPAVRFYKGSVDTLKTKQSGNIRGIDRGLTEALRAWVAEHPGQFIFMRTEIVEPISVEGLRAKLRRLAETHGFYYEGFSFHAFRRMFVTRVQQAGASSLETAAWVGHANESMTRVYTLSDLQRQHEIAETMGEQFRNCGKSVSVKAANG